MRSGAKRLDDESMLRLAKRVLSVQLMVVRLQLPFFFGGCRSICPLSPDDARGPRSQQLNGTAAADGSQQTYKPMKLEIEEG